MTNIEGLNPVPYRTSGKLFEVFSIENGHDVIGEVIARGQAWFDLMPNPETSLIDDDEDEDDEENEDGTQSDNA